MLWQQKKAASECQGQFTEEVMLELNSKVWMGSQQELGGEMIIPGMFQHMERAYHFMGNRYSLL